MCLSFEDIHFAHPGKQPLFVGTSLYIPSGTSMGFVGPSGCGKTTFAHLALRFFDPNQGCVRFEGIPLPEYPSTQQLRRRMGFVEQTPRVFAGTVRDNLTFGNPKPDSALIDVIDKVRPELWDTFEEGLDTKLGEGGIWISGGERQCVAIMREILKPVEFILFDEATSALDAESQEIAQSAIDASLHEGRTIIVIAHRKETVLNCDKVCSFGKQNGVTVIEGVASSLSELAIKSPTLRRSLKVGAQ